MSLPRERIRRIFVMENENTYLPLLRVCRLFSHIVAPADSMQPLPEADSRVRLIEGCGSQWESYDEIHDSEALLEHPWDEGELL